MMTRRIRWAVVLMVLGLWATTSDVMAEPRPLTITEDAALKRVLIGDLGQVNFQIYTASPWGWYNDYKFPVVTDPDTGDVYFDLAVPYLPAGDYVAYANAINKDGTISFVAHEVPFQIEAGTRTKVKLGFKLCDWIVVPITVDVDVSGGGWTKGSQHEVLVNWSNAFSPLDQMATYSDGQFHFRVFQSTATVNDVLSLTVAGIRMAFPVNFLDYYLDGDPVSIDTGEAVFVASFGMEHFVRIGDVYYDNIQQAVDSIGDDDVHIDDDVYINLGSGVYAGFTMSDHRVVCVEGQGAAETIIINRYDSPYTVYVSPWDRGTKGVIEKQGNASNLAEEQVQRGGGPIKPRPGVSLRNLSVFNDSSQDHAVAVYCEMRWFALSNCVITSSATAIRTSYADWVVVDHCVVSGSGTGMETFYDQDVGVSNSIWIGFDTVWYSTNQAVTIQRCCAYKLTYPYYDSPYGPVDVDPDQLIISDPLWYPEILRLGSASPCIGTGTGGGNIGLRDARVLILEKEDLVEIAPVQ
jgi:hypothetical protein